MAMKPGQGLSFAELEDGNIDFVHVTKLEDGYVAVAIATDDGKYALVTLSAKTADAFGDGLKEAAKDG